jgi:hypothetical protein
MKYLIYTLDIIHFLLKIMSQEGSEWYNKIVEVRGRIDSIMLAIDSNDFEERRGAKIEAGFIALEYQTIGPVVAFCNFICFNYYPYVKLSESQQSGEINKLYNMACDALDRMI